MAVGEDTGRASYGIVGWTVILVTVAASPTLAISLLKQSAQMLFPSDLIFGLFFGVFSTFVLWAPIGMLFGWQVSPSDCCNANGSNNFRDFIGVIGLSGHVGIFLLLLLLRKMSNVICASYGRSYVRVSYIKFSIIYLLLYVAWMVALDFSYSFAVNKYCSADCHGMRLW